MVMRYVSPAQAPLFLRRAYPAGGAQPHCDQPPPPPPAPPAPHVSPSIDPSQSNPSTERAAQRLDCGGLVFPEPACRRRASKGRRFNGVHPNDQIIPPPRSSPSTCSGCGPCPAPLFTSPQTFQP